MSSAYISTATPWPTYADGRPVLGENADWSVIDARIDALTRDELEGICEAADSSGLAEIVEYYSDEQVPDFADDEEEGEWYLREGERLVRERLKRAVRNVAENEQEVSFSFNGVRWTVETGGMSWGDAPSDSYQDIRWLAESGVCVKPVDAETFNDVPVMAATVAVLDDLAATALTSLKNAGLNAEEMAAAGAALEEARENVAAAAATFRYVFDKVKADRQDRAWDIFVEAKKA